MFRTDERLEECNKAKKMGRKFVYVSRIIFVMKQYSTVKVTQRNCLHLLEHSIKGKVLEDTENKEKI